MGIMMQACTCFRLFLAVDANVSGPVAFQLPVVGSVILIRHLGSWVYTPASILFIQ